MAEPGGFGWLPIHPSAILRTQVFEHVATSFGNNQEMPARKGSVLDNDIRRRATANRQRLIAEFPAFRCRSILS